MGNTKTINKLKSSCPKEFQDILNVSLEFAQKLYTTSLRPTGDKYLDHCLDTALRLQEQGFDYATVITGLLHHIEMTNTNLEYINKNISEEVSHLLQTYNEIESVVRSSNTSYLFVTRYILNKVKDLRPVLVQIASAQSNSHILFSIEDNEQDKNDILRNFNIYSKLAQYLGFGDIERDIREECFRITQKEEYDYITRLYEKENISQELLNSYNTYLKKLLKEYLGEIEIQSRIKSKYSTYLKSKKYIDEGHLNPIAHIRDLIGFRILTNDSDTCYKILDTLWEEGDILLDEFDDYIAHPKPNGYKAMQGPISFPEVGDLPIEIQILSKEMYIYNTFGPASHIAYKESRKRNAEASSTYDWIQEIHTNIENNKKNSPTDFSIPIVVNIFPDEVYPLTPKGEIKLLDKGNTVTDFAYYLHTEVGNSMIGAKVNSKASSLDYILQTGDVVEIITQKGKLYPNAKLLRCANSENAKIKINRAIK
ncbi:TGS domain-containing protein [bacterium]|nr:TGS domain-containing protein [bacterium]